VGNPLSSVHGHAQASRTERWRIREKKGLTQEQFASLSGFSQQYISGLEQGRRNPTVITLYELAIALGTSHMDLITPPKKRRR
jgi:transcriptional regulator with XRE-family HTH domain